MKKEIYVDGEIIELKKDWLGWRVIQRPKVWYEWITGSKKNLVVLIILMFIALLLYVGINEMISQYKAIADAPCKYCTNCLQSKITTMTNMTILP